MQIYSTTINDYLVCTNALGRGEKVCLLASILSLTEHCQDHVIEENLPVGFFMENLPENAVNRELHYNTEKHTLVCQLEAPGQALD